MCIAEVYMEGSMGTFDLGLRFCFVQCRRRLFFFKYKKITKVTRFLS